MEHQKVIVVDFGGQYTQLIVRRIRELGVYSEMVPWFKAEEEIRRERPDAVILSGGPRSVLEDGAPTLDLGVLTDLPVLGICYGQQLMAHKLGGRVEKSNEREYGARILAHVAPGSLVAEMNQTEVWMSHGDQVMSPPSGFTVTSSTATCPIASFQNESARQYGVQFHPEVSHTPGGLAILKKFLFGVAQLSSNWTAENFIEEAIGKIRQEVGDKKVLCAVSGGVDSSVVAALMTKALGDQVTCVFVDHGLLRKGEADQVVEMFTETFHPHLVVIRAHEQFFSALS
ncbi:MAG: glutamine-hydrolyzing GMP synthase, partial [Fimbriimonadaceae bacterium]|nr:glutamine-hydrolyzing GMP synthase [Fimbriimonadaceae bacterium]